jgi:excisionase family DNA binding protein
MQTVILTPEELTDLIENAVERSVGKHIPGAIRAAIKKPYLSTYELIQLTGWSRRTIQHLRDSRQLPFYQDGRRIIFKTDDIEKYFESRKIPARDDEKISKRVQQQKPKTKQ